MQLDYNYICHGLGNLSGLETRIYRGENMIEHCSHYSFQPDIVGLIQEKLKNRQENAFYIEEEGLLLFGIIQSKKEHVTIIIGPVYQIPPNRQETASILYRLGQPHNRLKELKEYFRNAVPYPFENFLEILCFVNYSLNEEKLTVSDLIRKSGKINVRTGVEWEDKTREEQVELHNTFQIEKIMLSYVSTGNVLAVQSFFKQPPAGRGGYVAHDELRQRKNIFICTATLVSRAAISGGMSPDTSFALSDRYIQKAELLQNYGDITNLSMEMILDYTKRIEIVKYGSNSSQTVKNVIRYVLKNIEKKISINDIASRMNMNRSYLCERFKGETGLTIGHFITIAKVDESKRMLSTSDLNISEISDYLSFSTQSYFQAVFKKIEGCTPNEYRNKIQG